MTNGMYNDWLQLLNIDNYVKKIVIVTSMYTRYLVRTRAKKHAIPRQHVANMIYPVHHKVMSHRGSKNWFDSGKRNDLILSLIIAVNTVGININLMSYVWLYFL